MTPSKARRVGREAFSPEFNAVEENPWPEEHVNHRDFFDGWKEGEKRYKADHQDFLVQCPMCDTTFTWVGDEPPSAGMFCPECKGGIKGVLNFPKAPEPGHRTIDDPILYGLCLDTLRELICVYHEHQSVKLLNVITMISKTLMQYTTPEGPPRAGKDNITGHGRYLQKCYVSCPCNNMLRENKFSGQCTACGLVPSWEDR